MTTYNVEIVVNGKDNASGAFGKVGGALGNMAQIAGGILGAQLFSKIGSAITGAASDALTSYASYERLGMSLTSMYAKELMNADGSLTMAQAMEAARGKAKDLQGWIQKLAIESPFSQEDVAASFRTAMAYGFTAEEAQRLTKATIDFASGSGASSAAMDKIALALGQIKAKGKLAGGEVLQLTEAGINVRDILAKAFNKTTAEIVEMQEKGLIPADKAIEAITQSLEKDFGGAAKAQSATFSGLISSLSDIKSVGLREFFTGTFQAIQPYVDKFVSKFSDPEFMAQIRTTGDAIGGFVSRLLENLPNVITSLSGMGDGLRKSVEPFLPALEWMGRTFELLYPEIQSVATILGFNLVSAGQQLSQKVFPFLVQTMDKFALWFATNRPLIEQFISALVGYVTNVLLPAFVGLWDVISPILGGIIDLVLGLVTTIMQIATGDWAGAWETIKSTVTDVALAIWEALGNFVNWVIELFTDLYDQLVGHSIIPDMMNAMLRIIMTITESIKTFWRTAWSNILLIISDALSKIKQAVSDAWSNIKQATSDAWNSVKQYISDAWNNIISTASTMISTLKSNISDGLNNLVTLFGGIAGKLRDQVNGWISAVMGAVSGFASIGSSIISNILSGLQANVGRLLSWLSGLISDLIGSLLGGGGGSPPGIDNFAAMRPAFATANAGPAFATSSAARAGGMMSGGRTVNNFFGPVTLQADGQIDIKKMLKDLR